MLNYLAVQSLLEESVGTDAVGAHGPFWRNLTRDEFVAKNVYGRALIVLNNSAASNLIKALRGEAPFGDDIGTPGASMPRMPAWRDPMGGDDIDAIAAWIDGGCPE